MKNLVYINYLDLKSLYFNWNRFKSDFAFLRISSDFSNSPKPFIDAVGWPQESTKVKNP